MLRGALAAALTPLRDGAFDADAVAPYVDFLAGHGLDGVLALGTTGEGVLFSPAERREVAAAFVGAAAAGSRSRSTAARRRPRTRPRSRSTRPRSARTRSP